MVRGTRVRWVGLLAAMAFVAACSGDGDDDDAEAADGDDAPQEITGVERTTETFVDDSRPTSASTAAPAADSRTLETLIAYPTPLDGKYPLVVFGHGFTGHPSRHAELLGAWAEAGYVVAAPVFPRTNSEQPGGFGAADVTDLKQQPADASFVIDAMLDLGADPESPLEGHIDADRIGLAGHSLGGATAVGAVFNTCCTDERIDAAALLAVAPPELFAFFEGELDPRPVPTLMVVADGDFVFPASEAVYPMLSSPKWYVTLRGEGNGAAQHVGPFEDAPDPADERVKEITTAFWDLELKDDEAAQARMEEAAEPADGSASLQSDKE